MDENTLSQLNLLLKAVEQSDSVNDKDTFISLVAMIVKNADKQTVQNSNNHC